MARPFIIMKNHVRILTVALYLILTGFFSSARADEEELKEIYLRAFNLFQQASAEQRLGNWRPAEEQFRCVRELLVQIQQENPQWQKSIVDYLRCEAESALQVIQEAQKSELAPPVDRTFREIPEPLDSARLEGEIQKYQKLVSQQEEKLNQLLASVEKSQQDSQAGLQKQKELQDRIAEFEKAKASLDIRLAELEKAKSALEGQLEERSRQLQGKETLLDEKEKTLAELGEEKRGLLAQQEKSIQELKQKLEQTRLEKDQGRQELEKERRKQLEMTTAVKERDLLREKMAQISVQLNQREGELANLKTEFGKQQEQLKIAQRELEKERLVVKAAAKEKVTALEQKAQIQAGYDKLVADYQKRNEETQAIAKEYDSEKTKWEQENTRLKLGLEGLEKEKFAVEQKLVTVTTRYDAMVKELNASFDRVKGALDAKLALAQQERKEAAQSVQSKSSEINTVIIEYKKKYQTAMLNLQKNYEDQLARLNEKIARLEKAPAQPQPAAPVPVSAKEKEDLVQAVAQKKAEKSQVGPPVYDRKAVLHYNQGVDLAEKGQIDQAQAEFKKALEIFPNFFEARFNLGRTYVMQAKKKEAVEEYLKALKIKEDPDVYYGLGAIYWELGQWEKVVQNWEEVLKRAPQHPLAGQWLPKAKEKLQKRAAVSSPQS